MLTEPSDLDRDDLAALLERHWGLRTSRLEYLPVGFGSHHWRAVCADGRRRFVTADDLEAPFQVGPDADGSFDALARAHATAAALAEAGLEFVVAPLRDGDGVVLRRLGARYAVTVFPLLEGESSSWGDYETADERRRMGDVLGRLHAASPHVPPDLPRPEDFAVPSRATLEAALGDLDARWTTGPFGEPAREALAAAADAVRRLLAEYDELVAAARERGGDWVVTHGEPHRANVMHGRDGSLHLVDWDTTRLAPRERDLWMVLDDDHTGWDEYRAAAGDVELDVRTLDLYRRWWDLADIATFVAEFRRPHGDDRQMAESWENLRSNLARA